MGVIRKVTARPPKNPNKVGKMLTRWYNNACRVAHRRYKQLLRSDGKQAASTKAAFCTFHSICSQARWSFTAGLPTLLKYYPKWFWKVIL